MKRLLLCLSLVACSKDDSCTNAFGEESSFSGGYLKAGTAECSAYVEGVSKDVIRVFTSVSCVISSVVNNAAVSFVSYSGETVAVRNLAFQENLDKVVHALATNNYWKVGDFRSLVQSHLQTVCDKEGNEQHTVCSSAFELFSFTLDMPNSWAVPKESKERTALVNLEVLRNKAPYEVLDTLLSQCEGADCEALETAKRALDLEGEVSKYNAAVDEFNKIKGTETFIVLPIEGDVSVHAIGALLEKVKVQATYDFKWKEKKVRPMIGTILLNEDMIPVQAIRPVEVEDESYQTYSDGFSSEGFVLTEIPDPKKRVSTRASNTCK